MGSGGRVRGVGVRRRGGTGGGIFFLYATAALKRVGKLDISDEAS